MHLLLIAAALSNQLWFETQQQDNALVITPMATLVDDCRCQLTINVVHQGQSGQSNSSQSGSVLLKGQHPQPLANMTLELPHGEWTQITVTLSNSKGVLLQQSWSSPARV
ncbi:curli assembly protein CsgC [Kluyvera ascorbata]|uniref:Curli assembly protein CsgC n=1 Tax=Kluyvera ascorbata TaxID=51288 RepID=A0A3N2RS27_9ENTR|nr:curli assembly protein CsgC [Kluyvera ascorbata]